MATQLSLLASTSTVEISAKVSIALAKGKKLHDKRETLKRKTQMREAQQAMKNYNR